MSKAKISHYENGATLIYQKDPNIRGFKIAFGFRGGSQFDGEYPGLSHLIEHLSFRGNNDTQSKNFLTKLLVKCGDLKARTSQDTIVWSFSATDENIEETIDMFMDRMRARKLSQDQILREIDVVLHEIELSDIDDIGGQRNTDEIIGNLQINNRETKLKSDILGDYKSLKKNISSEIINDYIRKYFNDANLLVSIVSNSSQTKCAKIFENHILPKVYKTKSLEYIAKDYEKTYYYPSNILSLVPDETASGVIVKLYLRERTLLFIFIFFII